MNCLRRNYLILAFLVFLFAAPGIFAYFFYKHTDLLASDTINKGLLLNPPVLVSEPSLTSKWSLVLWNPGDCKKTCTEQLDKLARIRLALGRRLYNVDINLFLGPNSAPLPSSLLALLNEQAIHVVQYSAENHTQLQSLPDDSKVYIMNPEHFLILSYALDAPSEDMFQDIKHLLKTKE